METDPQTLAITLTTKESARIRRARQAEVVSFNFLPFPLEIHSTFRVKMSPLQRCIPMNIQQCLIYSSGHH